MAISRLISEAQKIIPAELDIAHAGEVISLEQWDNFDSLIAAKNPASVH